MKKDKEQIALLVSMAQEHDQTALAELYEAVYSDLYFICLNVLKNKENAEDIVQDSFITCMTKMDTLKDDHSFASFINRIAVNKCIDLLRKRGKELSDITVNDEGEEVIMDIEDSSKLSQPEKIINDKEIQRLVMEIIDRLPEFQRVSVLLYYYQDLSVAQVAETMECSENTVKSRLNYARKYIKLEV